MSPYFHKLWYVLQYGYHLASNSWTGCPSLPSSNALNYHGSLMPCSHELSLLSSSIVSLPVSGVFYYRQSQTILKYQSRMMQLQIDIVRNVCSELLAFFVFLWIDSTYYWNTRLIVIDIFWKIQISCRFLISCTVNWGLNLVFNVVITNGRVNLAMTLI